jgi:hypothetical protein
MYWWQTLLGESLIVTFFLAVSAAIAYLIERLSVNQHGDNGTTPVMSTEEILQTLVYEYKTRDSQANRLQWYTFGVGVLTFLVVSAYTTVAAFQWRAMQRSNRINRDVAKATQDSANAAVAASRSWIVPSGKTRTWIVKPGNRPEYWAFEIEWVNAGATPALNFESTAEYRLTDPPRFHAGCTVLEQSKWKSITFMILKGGTYTMPFQDLPPEWNVNRIGYLYVHGCIWYTDVLTNVRRTTEFYYEIARGHVFPVVLPPPLNGG